MSVSMKNVDVAFQNVGQKVGMEIWRIENFNPVPVPKSGHGRFYSRDSYIILKTTALKSGILHHDIHFWLGKDTTQDTEGTASMKSVELDAALGGRAVQHREVQGHETDKFLTYFRPCIIPLQGSFSSGYIKIEAQKHETRLFMSKGKRVVRVTEVPFARSSLTHEDIFILDTKSKIFQFNGVKSNIHERAKALDAVQYIEHNYHEGKCDIAIVEDGKLVADADTGEFWAQFGGYAPIPRKGAVEDDSQAELGSTMFLLVDGKLKEVGSSPFKRETLRTEKCYILDCGAEIYVWAGRETSLDERKNAMLAAEDHITNTKTSHTHLTRVIEGFEPWTFKSNFDVWPSSTGTAVSEEGRGKVAALLKQQGFNVKGLIKAAPPAKEVVPPLLDNSGKLKLQVWRVMGDSKTQIFAEEHGKFYSGDCYIVLYTYPGDRKEDYLLCSWFGKHSTEKDQAVASSLAGAMTDSMRGRPILARIIEGKEPAQFIALFQKLIILKGGHSPGYKDMIATKGIEDETYSETSVALFHVHGTSFHNAHAVQVNAVATSLNSSYSFILQTETSLLLWYGTFGTQEEQQVAAHLATFLKPDTTAKSLKEGSEPSSFWSALGGKSEYPSQREAKEAEKDPRLFVCTSMTDTLEVIEVFNYTQDDLVGDDVLILCTYGEVFIWIGQATSSREKKQGFSYGQKYLERASQLEGISQDIPIYKILEGCEPSFFTCYFTWDATKNTVITNSFDRKLALLQGRPIPIVEPLQRRLSSSLEKIDNAASKSSRRIERGIENARRAHRKSAVSALTSIFNLSTIADNSMNSPSQISPAASTDSRSTYNGADEKFSLSLEVSSAISEDILKVDVEEKDTEPVSTMEIDETQKHATFPYERLKAGAKNPISGIDITRRESYLSPSDFQKIFYMDRTQFDELPKWKQDKFKKAVDLF
ncbi:hypothetical protein O6H91_08G029400 [Diphasiastrum complanatum]|uniref:Uncharacterized protein n=3 Tax=Diphasiastrum complanatum TaxID=34168 RepID=A0ACC2CWA0_DIPCM|nr:hypothetical protein O6H91_08G029400 [Diphasiastrum complanatum]KAJ7546204.1 hypothetical protein O6H91_08G029400 [Diphasiastrum complanatum]KAJ7546206.1 hypothetical protein O6H91_08G029400 [Diphasiastrum complanatum]